MNSIFTINRMIEVYKISCKRPGKREALTLLVLTLVGLFGNYLNIDLFFGVNFIFGSIATMIAIRISGPFYGALVGIVIASYSYILWGHPYAIIIFGLEGFIIGFFVYVLKKDSMILIDVGYWLVIGIPLGWVLYSYSIGLPQPIVITLAAKQMTNGIINVAVASLIIQFTPLLRWIGLGSFRIKYEHVTMHSSVITLLSLFILIPMLVVTISSAKSELKRVEQKQENLVNNTVVDVQIKMIGFLRNYSNVLEAMATTSMNNHHEDNLLNFAQNSTPIPGLLSTEILSADGERLFSFPAKPPLSISQYANNLSSIVSDALFFLVDDEHEVRHLIVMKSISDGNFLLNTFNAQIFQKHLNILSREGQLIELLDNEGLMILGTNSIDLSGFVRGVGVNKHKLFPENKKLSSIQRAKQSYYDGSIAFSKTNDWKVYVAVPMAESIQTMQTNYREKFILMLIISVFSLLLVPFVVRPLSNPLKELTKTADMLEQAIKRSDIIWPTSNINEVNSLINQFHRFVNTINEKQLALIDSEKNLKELLNYEKELSLLKTNFVSMVSHEFRTPLTAISSTTDIILKYSDKMTQDEINLRLEKIKQEVGNMTTMLEDILIIGQADAQKLEYNPESLDLVSLIKNIIVEYQLSDPDNRTVIYHLSSDVIMAKVDEKWIKNIVLNLIINAIKYSDKDTDIEVSISEDQAGVSLSVKDYGIGISKEDIKQLFEPFYRASNVGNIPGTGLGLVVLQKSLDLHKGKIEIESEVGKGSRFIVTLPHV